MTASRPSRTRLVVLHSFRIVVFATVLLLIHRQAEDRIARRTEESQPPVEWDVLQSIYPEATRLGSATEEGGIGVFDSAGRRLGYYLQTAPAGDRFVGFSGPTNVLVAFDANDQILSLRILSSRDTKEHVRQVIEDERFLPSFSGLSRADAIENRRVDAVSGATLTSHAIQEAVAFRLGGTIRSLRFPDPLALIEVQSLFPAAEAIEQIEDVPSRWNVLGANREELGQVLRTAPAADNLVGYQGPSETLIGVGTDDQISGLILRGSFDNEPYVTYVREDSYFLNRFNGLSLAELGGLDLQAAEIEGVSGATMTSMSVARGIVLAARELSRSRSIEPQQHLRWSLHDMGTAAMIVAGCTIGFTSLRAIRLLKLGYQLLLVAYLGLMNGDMVSLAMMAGWAQYGIPWRSAGSLLLLSATALIVPITTRRNIYCTHLCPHGAVQQLLKNRIGRRLHMPRGLSKLLRSVPFLLLVWTLLVVMWPLPYSLVDIEPFDAWVFRVAGWATVGVAIVGLAASLFVPMAYCRYGCPTGAILSFLRLNAHSERWSPRDWAAVLLLLLAVVLG